MFSYFNIVCLCAFVTLNKNITYLLTYVLTSMCATVSACAICLVFPSNFVFFNVFCAQINGGGDGDFTCNHGIRAAPLTSGVAR